MKGRWLQIDSPGRERNVRVKGTIHPCLNLDVCRYFFPHGSTVAFLRLGERAIHASDVCPRIVIARFSLRQNRSKGM
jgi:hypothetical protein